jgi:hypothetical protein
MNAISRKCRIIIYQLFIMMCQAVVIPDMLPGSNRNNMIKGIRINNLYKSRAQNSYNPDNDRKRFHKLEKMMR